MNIKDYLETITEFPHRSDCPECGNRNTFSADTVDDAIVYHCFHINCGIKGRIKSGLQLDSLYSIRDISNVYMDRNGQLGNGEYITPTHFTNPLQNRICFSFMRRWKLDIPYMEQRVGLRYDPNQNRCVFEIRDISGAIRGATGRLLQSGVPKWYIYERQMGCPGIVQTTNRNEGSPRKIILVEDMISACRVSEVENAAALLGTSISEETISHLLSFKELVIALDQDATQKALKLQQELSAYRPTKVLPLIEDLKYLTKEQIKDKLDEISSI